MSRVSSLARAIAHPLRVLGSRRGGRGEGVEIIGTAEGQIRTRSRNGETVYLPAAAMSAGAPVEVQRAALQAFAHLTIDEIPNAGTELEGLCAVVERIWSNPRAHPSMVGSWLRGPSRGLDFKSPLEALRAGRIDDVMLAASCIVALVPTAEAKHFTRGAGNQMLGD